MTQVAKTIFEQLGGNKFAAMTGAINFSEIENGLTFCLPKKLIKNKSNHVIITLMPDDTYTVKFVHLNEQYVLCCSASYTDVYFDQLTEIISHETGLATSL